MAARADNRVMTPRRLIAPARLAGTALLRQQSDARLVDLTRAGNDAAFEAIVHRYRAELLRYCGRVLPASRVEDAVQQAFVSAHTALATGSADIALRPWLYRIAHNQAISMLRQNGWDNDPITELNEGVHESPDAVHERREDLRDAIAAVRDLPERQRDALVLRALEERSYHDIATQLGLTGGAVRQLVMRARSSLRAGATAFTPPILLLRLVHSGGSTSVGGAAATTAVGAGFAHAGAATLAAVVIAAGATGVVVSDGGAQERSKPGSRAAHAPAGAGPQSQAGAATPAGASVGARERLGARKVDATAPGGLPGDQAPGATDPSGSAAADPATGDAPGNGETSPNGSGPAEDAGGGSSHGTSPDSAGDDAKPSDDTPAAPDHSHEPPSHTHSGASDASPVPDRGRDDPPEPDAKPTGDDADPHS
jgi:RNA polymerase sigma factor (sigma-70 family)